MTGKLDPGYQDFPYPHDIDPEEIDEEDSFVRKKKPKPVTFIEGDEIANLLSEIAGELYDRGETDLASEISGLIAGG